MLSLPWVGYKNEIFKWFRCAALVCNVEMYARKRINASVLFCVDTRRSLVMPNSDPFVRFAFASSCPFILISIRYKNVDEYA